MARRRRRESRVQRFEQLGSAQGGSATRCSLAEIVMEAPRPGRDLKSRVMLGLARHRATAAGPSPQPLLVTRAARDGDAAVQSTADAVRTRSQADAPARPAPLRAVPVPARVGPRLARTARRRGSAACPRVMNRCRCPTRSGTATSSSRRRPGRCARPRRAVNLIELLSRLDTGWISRDAVAVQDASARRAASRGADARVRPPPGRMPSTASSTTTPSSSGWTLKRTLPVVTRLTSSRSSTSRLI